MNRPYQNDDLELAPAPSSEMGDGYSAPSALQRNQEDSQQQNNSRRRRGAATTTVTVLLEVLTANPKLREQLDEAIRAHLADLGKGDRHPRQRTGAR